VTTNWAYGSSFLVYLLPYVEFGSVYGRLAFTGNSGYGNIPNLTVKDGVNVPVYRCPSSTLPLFSRTSEETTAPAINRLIPTYAGIAGATDDLVAAESARQNTGANVDSCVPCAGGKSAAGGVLFPNSQVRLNEISDGASNTMIVSESASELVTTDGQKRPWYSGRGGMYIGANSLSPPPSYRSGGDNRHQNLLSIRYRINRKTGWTPGPNGQGDCGTVGVCANQGNNYPLTSDHPGGVNALFADGAVRFLRDDLSPSTLGLLAVRDDGSVITEGF
jgi:prepilin-type processing-associated H-X9-DG protein